MRRYIKLCLMSATMDANLFSGYFGGAPTFSVPGRGAIEIERRFRVYIKE
jgi:HrpA-like RNA helicase